MNKTLLALACLAAGWNLPFSWAEETTNSAVEIHRSSPVAELAGAQLSLAELSDVHAHSYVVSHTWTTVLPVNCTKAVNELIELFVQDMPQKDSVWDYVMGCVPDGRESFITFQILIEPRESAQIPVVEKYVEKHQDLVWSKLTFHFHHLGAYDIQKSVDCVHLPNPNNWQNWDFHASLESDGYSATFTTFRDYRLHLDAERQAFRAAKAEDLYAYLTQIFGEKPFSRFKSDSLRKANLVRSNNPMTIRLENGSRIDSTWSDGHFRECYRFDGGFCAKD